MAWRVTSPREGEPETTVSDRLEAEVLVIEGVIGHGFRLGQIEGRSLIEQEISLRWTPGRREGRGQVWQVEVQENGGDDGRIGEKGEGLHLAAAGRAGPLPPDLIRPGSTGFGPEKSASPFSTSGRPMTTTAARRLAFGASTP